MNFGTNGLPGTGSASMSLEDLIQLDFQYWKRRVGDAGGGTSEATDAAVMQFITAIHRGGLRDRFVRLNLFCGDSLVAARVPVFVDVFPGGCVGLQVDTSVGFVASDYTAQGLVGAVGKHLQTGVSPTWFTECDTHLALWNPKSVATGAGGIGSSLVAGTNTALAGYFPYSDGTAASDMYSASVELYATPPTTPYGLLMGSKTSRTAHNLLQNGVVFASQTSHQGALPTSGEMYALAINRTAGTTHYYVGLVLMYSMGRGMTAVQALAFTEAMRVFLRALGRIP